MTETSKPRVFRASDLPAAQMASTASLEDDPTLPPDSAAEVPSARGPSLLARLFWGAAIAFIGLMIGSWIWDSVTAMFARHPWLGWFAVALGAIVLLGVLYVVLRELAALSRMGRVDGLREQAEAAWDTGERRAAESVLRGVVDLYGNRDDFDRPRKEIGLREGDAPDGETLLTLLETESMRALDARASDAARRASGRVAASTALLPSGVLDALAVLFFNVRMVREIAEVYGGRAGWLGSWRLLKNVAIHLAATGAIALGDDLVGAALGGGVLAKLSRRAGEGVLNGALTARIGVATMEVCRPLPFRALPRPSVRAIAGSALKGFVSRAEKAPSS